MRFCVVAMLGVFGCAERQQQSTSDLGVVDSDGDGFVSEEDCDDDDTSINPGAEEVCDGTDNDCDGQIDEEVQIVFYLDEDQDGFGDPEQTLLGCETPNGYVVDGVDCNDQLSTTHPGAIEYCDTEDNDCDGVIDEDAVDAVTWYADMDLDGFGDPNNTILACDLSDGFVTNDNDCDDMDALSFDYDQCGVCGGDNSSCVDCAGVANGDHWMSDCGCLEWAGECDCVAADDNWLFGDVWLFEPDVYASFTGTFEFALNGVVGQWSNVMLVVTVPECQSGPVDLVFESLALNGEQIDFSEMSVVEQNGEGGFFDGEFLSVDGCPDDESAPYVVTYTVDVQLQEGSNFIEGSFYGDNTQSGQQARTLEIVFGDACGNPCGFDEDLDGICDDVDECVEVESAGFVGSMAEEYWNFYAGDGDGSVEFGELYVDENGFSVTSDPGDFVDTMLLVGANNNEYGWGDALGFPGTSTSTYGSPTSMSIELLQSGEYTFQWLFQTDDANAMYDVFYYQIEGVSTMITSPTPGLTQQSGTVSLDVSQVPSTLVIGIDSTDSCCGAASVGIYGLMAPPVCL